MAVKSILDSTGLGTNSEVENFDRRDFLGVIRYTPLMSASNRLNLDIELNWNDETRNDEDFEDGDFPVLKSISDRRDYAHHSNCTVFCKTGSMKKSTILRKNLSNCIKEHTDMFQEESIGSRKKTEN